jgi:hypothetical protein
MSRSTRAEHPQPAGRLQADGYAFTAVLRLCPRVEPMAAGLRSLNVLSAWETVVVAFGGALLLVVICAATWRQQGRG